MTPGSARRSDKRSGFRVVAHELIYVSASDKLLGWGARSRKKTNARKLALSRHSLLLHSPHKRWPAPIPSPFFPAAQNTQTQKIDATAHKNCIVCYLVASGSPDFLCTHFVGSCSLSLLEHCAGQVEALLLFSLKTRNRTLPWTRPLLIFARVQGSSRISAHGGPEVLPCACTVKLEVYSYFFAPTSFWYL